MSRLIANIVTPRPPIDPPACRTVLWGKNSGRIHPLENLDVVIASNSSLNSLARVGKMKNINVFGKIKL